MTALDERPEVDAPPCDPAAERSVIGGAMATPDAFTAATAVGLTSRDFYEPANEAIWEAITSLSERGESHDPLGVRDEMDRVGTLRLVSPIALTTMMGSSYPRLAGDHAKLIVHRSALRRAIAAADRIRAAARMPGADLGMIQAQALEAIESMAIQVGETTWSTLDDILARVREAAIHAAEHGRPGGITFGLRDVDDVMSPMVPGEFAVISAFSGGGKSIASCGVALHAAIHLNKRVLIHAMEMTRLEVGQRWVSSEARVDLTRVINGNLTAAEWGRIERAYEGFHGADLIVDEVETVTLASLRASVRRHGPEFVVVDQIPTMTATDSRASRQEQVAALAYGLKRIAMAESVPVLACTQLGSNPTKRSDRTPTMHDLRESQAIVHAANTLIVLSDPADVDKDSGRLGEVDWIVRKQRQGPKDVTVPLARQFHYSRLSDLAS